MKKKYHVSVVMAFIVICVMIIIGMNLLMYIHGLIHKSILASLEEITNQDAERLENRIQEHIRILKTIINEIQQKNAENEQDIFNIYNRNLGNEEFSRIAILYKDGRTITSDGKIVDFSDEINLFFSSSDIQLSKSRKSKVNQEEINIYSQKISFQNEEVVILLVIDNDKYKNLFSQNIFQGNGIECLITADGEIIINSQNEKNNGNIFEDFKYRNPKKTNKVDEMKNEILKKQEGQISYKIQEKIYYISYKKMTVGDWLLVIIVPETIIANELMQVLDIIVEISILIVIITFFITSYIIISKFKKEEELYKLAYIDPITNLGNNNGYLKSLKEKIEVDSKKMIMILDIDKFKTFNKKYGHMKGNKLLKRVGEEIKQSIRKTDTVCRLGNDVFGILLMGEIDVKNITERLNRKISRIQIDNIWYNIRICIGVYIWNTDEKNIQIIIDKAIMAHDSVKGKYKELYGVFTEDFEEQLSKESEIENMMEEAIQNKEFEVYYQPQISTKTEKIQKAEALVRWNKNGKQISPGDFIPIFEKNLFIIKLDEYIYEIVCQHIQEIRKRIKNMPQISINISKETLIEKEFLKKYMQITQKYHIEPKQIEFEITERTTVNDDVDIKNILLQIKKKGFGIAIDDFGTGYSSLNVLDIMPIDTLKIDKSFIDKINIQSRTTDLLEIIISIAKKLHLKTVAEGVERSEQVEYLKLLNCDLIQGYIYARPLDVKAFEKYIKENG